MTELENRLRVLADHIDAELDGDVDAAVVRVASDHRRMDRRHVVVVAAVGLIALAGGLVVALRAQPGPAPVGGAGGAADGHASAGKPSAARR